jgi:hypothetical protein
MPRRTRRISQEEATSQCAWCHQELAPDAEVYSVAAQAKPWVDLPRAGVLELSLDATHQRVLAIIPAPGSPARLAGNDLLFATCSQACAEALKAAIDKQFDFEEGPGLN